MLAVALFALALQGLRLTTDEDKSRPISRVIKLLKEMQAQLVKEAKEDQDLYEKFSCWCKTNGKEKDEAVEVAGQRIEQLTATIEELTSTSAELNADIKKTKKQIAEDRAALAKATAIREKESAAFTNEEKDMIQSVQALKSAVTVLSKHHPSSAELLEIQNLIANLSHKRGDRFLLPRRNLGAFLQVQEPGLVREYESQSGEIFGILKQMLVNFNDNLSQSQKDEAAAQDAYNALRAAKEEQIATGKEELDNKMGELADTDNKLADAKEDLEDTRKALSADQKFLLDLRKRCKANDEEWEERSKTRQEEIQAVSETIDILNNDDSFEKRDATFNFLQQSIVRRRFEASKVLREAAAKSKNPELLALSVSAKLDAFTKVKKYIDTMIEALKQQQDDEVKHKDWCNEEFNTNENQTANANKDKEDQENRIADLTQQIETLTQEIKDLNANVAEMQVQIQRASENRAAENKEFQQTVTDQRDTQSILQRALNRLQRFYGKDKELVQVTAEPGAEAPPPPQGFKEHKNNAGATGVVGLLNQIIADAKHMESDAMKAEQDAQSAYENFVDDSNAAIAQLQREIVNKTETKASANQDKSVTDQGLAGTVKELEKLANYNGELHKNCDFTLKNFEVRQTARQEEVTSLQQAKQILSGADFS